MKIDQLINYLKKRLEDGYTDIVIENVQKEIFDFRIKRVDDKVILSYIITDKIMEE